MGKADSTIGTLAGAMLAGVAGCALRRRPRKRHLELHPSLFFQDDPDSGTQILDLDLRGPLRPRVIARNVSRVRWNHVGDALTVAEWVQETGAIAGVNGGFFGDTYDAAGRRRQIVQLAVVDGEVVAPGGAVESTGAGQGERYVRSAIGFTGDGSPRMEWSAGTRRHGPRRIDVPIAPFRIRPWDIESAVACGPRLIHRGNPHITDQAERLRSPESVARTFVAFDSVGGHPGHLVLGCADAMRYPQIARFLENYFQSRHGTQVAEAMCLDGGASSQLAYQHRGELVDARPTGVFVPTSIVIAERSR